MKIEIDINDELFKDLKKFKLTSSGKLNYLLKIGFEVNQNQVEITKFKDDILKSMENNRKEILGKLVLDE